MSSKIQRIPTLIVIVALVLAVATYVFYTYGRAMWVPAYQKVAGKQTVSEVLETIGPRSRRHWQEQFAAAGLSYPPQRLTFLAVKDTALLEVWAGEPGAATFITSYPIQKLSGQRGPKLREGDRQVPEGIYSISGLNPNSSYHLSMKLDYPNAFDLQHANAEGRSQPGTNIFIHGKAVSVGCLAMGDPAIEELFVLVADTRYSNVSVVIAPEGPRLGTLTVESEHAWVPQLYSDITREFLKYPTPEGI